MIEQHCEILNRLYELRKYIRESYPEYGIRAIGEVTYTELINLSGEEYWIKSIIDSVDCAIDNTHSMVSDSFVKSIKVNA